MWTNMVQTYVVQASSVLHSKLYGDLQGNGRLDCSNQELTELKTLKRPVTL